MDNHDPGSLRGDIWKDLYERVLEELNHWAAYEKDVSAEHTLNFASALVRTNGDLVDYVQPFATDDLNGYAGQDEYEEAESDNEAYYSGISFDFSIRLFAPDGTFSSKKVCTAVEQEFRDAIKSEFNAFDVNVNCSQISRPFDKATLFFTIDITNNAL